MRRSIAVVATTLALTATALTTGAAGAADDDLRLGDAAPATRSSSQPPAQASPSAGAALDHAADLIHGHGAPGGVPEVSLALRDLAVALPRLSGAERRQARDLLARPQFNGRTRRDCSRAICLHWSTGGADAPPNRRWVRKTMRVLQKVWRTEVGAMDYRRPRRDGRRGGNAKFDVYLQDVGGQGYYGYCSPDGPSGTRIKRSYCVLDDDFARSQFGAKPIISLKATAAHEFFHAVQFAYDAGEDGWFMEATATWMEDRVYDGVNDNRQYLRYGQVGKPWVSLDRFSRNGFSQYGNWAYFDYLSKRFGDGVVKRAWRQAGNYRGAGKTYSIDAVSRALPRRAGFDDTYARFVAANLTPSHSYPEGDKWPTPRMGDTVRLGRGDRASGTLRVDHLAAYDVRATPRRSLDTRRWRLRVSVDGPAAKRSPEAAVVVVRQSGKVSRRMVALDKTGAGQVRVPFNRRQVKHVFVAAINASSRYDCSSGTSFACHGRPLDQDRPFDVVLTVFRRR